MCAHRYDGQGSMSLEDCKSICSTDEDCKGIEHWAGGRMGCYKCSDPDETSAYTNSNDLNILPSVYKKDDGQL